MPRLHGLQTNFTGGQFSPRLEGRHDLPRYSNSVRTLKNMTVMQQGGATRRWGFHFVETTKNNGIAVLIPFIFSEDISYMLEFGSQYIRFYTHGFQIKQGIGAEEIVNGEFTYDIGYWTNVSTGTGSAVYNAGKSRLAGGAAGVGAIEQAISTKIGSTYTLTFDVFTNTTTIRIGTTTTGQEILADAAKTAGSHVVIFTATTTTTYIGFRNAVNVNLEVDNVSCKSGTELITNPTCNTNITGWTDKSILPGVVYYSSGKLALTGKAGVGGTGWVQESVSTIVGTYYVVVFDVSGTNIEIRIGTTDGGNEILEDTLIPVGDNNLISFLATDSTAYIGFRKTLNEVSYIDNVFCRAWNTYEIVNTYSTSDLSKINYVQYVDAMFLVHSNYAPRQLICAGDIDWTLSEVDFIDGPYMDEETDITITPSALTGTITLTASAPLFDPLHVGALFRIKHIVATEEIWGYVKITAFTDSTHVTALVKKDLGDITASEAYREGSWSDYRGFPSTIVFYEDRILYGNTRSQPQTIWGSKSGDYTNFTPGTDDADAFYYTLASAQINVIQWMKRVKPLIVGTMGEEFSVTGGSDAPVTPTNVQVVSESNYGSASVQAERVGNAILFTQRLGKKIRELSFNWESDTYVGQDISIVAENLISNGVKKIVYQQEPNSILWIMDMLGNLVGCTYERLNDVVAWHSHETDGVIEDISVMPNASLGHDELWVIANRTIGGETKRYIEYGDPELQTDSALTYSGPAVTSVSGLDHLIGKTVDIRGDGVIYPQKVVSGSGSVSLEGSLGCTSVEVGLHYDSELETMRPEFPVSGTSQGIPKRWNEVFVRLYESIGCTINGEMLPFRTPSNNMGEGIDVFTGDKRITRLGWDRDGRINIKQTQALPLTVLAIFGTIDLGE